MSVQLDDLDPKTRALINKRLKERADATSTAGATDATTSTLRADATSSSALPSDATPTTASAATTRARSRPVATQPEGEYGYTCACGEEFDRYTRAEKHARDHGHEKGHGRLSMKLDDRPGEREHA